MKLEDELIFCLDESRNNLSAAARASSEISVPASIRAISSFLDY